MNYPGLRLTPTEQVPRATPQRGWARYLRIMQEYPVAPLELVAGLTVILRGAYVLWPDNWEKMSRVWIHLAFQGIEVHHVAAVWVLAGIAQIVACLEQWHRTRLLTATVIFALVIWLITEYWAVEHDLLWPVIYTTLLVTEGHIILRSVPLFTPRWVRRLHGPG